MSSLFSYYQIFCLGGVLRDPITSCGCDRGDMSGSSVDPETAAFYNVYKASAEAPMWRIGENVRYNVIPKAPKFVEADKVSANKQ